MKSICLYFQVHLPFRYRRYRFFDIGNDHYYYDDYSNETIIKKLAEKNYLPANELLLKLAHKLEGKFKVSFSITGLDLEQFELYSPEVIESFKKLSKTGCIEFLSGTYSNTLSSFKNPCIFEKQVKLHEERIFDLFGQKSRVFMNTEMIYSDEIGALVAKMGYKSVLTEGARHILGWKSPNFVYVNAINPKMKILMRNFKLSDDISSYFSDKSEFDYPLIAEKITGWLEKIDQKEEVINIFLNYELFGELQLGENCISDIWENFAMLIAKNPTMKFATPSEIIEELQPVSIVNVPNPISWANEERDLTLWLGNDMQKEACEKLYSLGERMEKCSNAELHKDWNYLQASDHFYYMSTKNYLHNNSKNLSNPFDTPYEAFINYMNILSDFKIRLNSFVTEHEI
ncbi:MAG: glycoside hydrolase family 57 protein [Bacteroidales bacterium]|jgi:alpha-amylase|nr:glycoside hydrolase family 57 protein [Bacteroidales bacterium]